MTYRTVFKIIGILSVITLAVLAYAFSTYDPNSPSSIKFREKQAVEAREDSIAGATEKVQLERQRVVEKRTRVLSPEEKRERLIERQFSKWDGSHKELVKHIKSTMNGPSSFEHVETFYWDTGGDTFVVQTTFRGKIVYGGVVTNTVKGKANVDNGSIVEIL